jgi:hypothetical protein
MTANVLGAFSPVLNSTVLQESDASSEQPCPVSKISIGFSGDNEITFES